MPVVSYVVENHTPDEVEKILSASGFDLIEDHSQNDRFQNMSPKERPKSWKLSNENGEVIAGCGPNNSPNAKPGEYFFRIGYRNTFIQKLFKGQKNLVLANQIRDSLEAKLGDDFRVG